MQRFRIGFAFICRFSIFDDHSRLQSETQLGRRKALDNDVAEDCSQFRKSTLYRKSSNKKPSGGPQLMFF